MSQDNFYKKYLKYKAKYLKLKNSVEKNIVYDNYKFWRQNI